MSNRYPGGFITADEPTVNTSEADGIWTLEQQAGYQGQGVWPLPAQLIQRSLRFNSADSAYLSRTPPSAGNRKTWTWSGWVKRGSLGGSQQLFHAQVPANDDTSYFSFRFMSGNEIGVVLYSYYPLISTPIYRDVSGWYHIMCVLDTTQASASDRLKIYINGAEVTAWGTDNRASIAQNSELAVNRASPHAIGAIQGFVEYFNGLMAEVHFVDGQALTPSSFGYTNASTGVWTPIAYAGTYGQNGFYLPFNDNSAAINLGLNGIPYTTDQAWPNTTLLLNTNGTNAAQNNTFLDSSDNTFTVTRNGNTTQGRFSPFAVADGEWSNYFDGTGNQLTASPLTDLALGAGDYTIEFWANISAFTTYGTFVATYNNATTAGAWFLRINNTTQQWQWQNGANGSAPNFKTYNSSTNLTVGQWHHLAVVRSSGVVVLYQDGVNVGGGVDAETLVAPNFTIGRAVNGYELNGYLSNLRITKGTALYTTAFTPSTEPLTTTSQGATSSEVEILTCQSNRFVDNSSNTLALTVVGNPKVTPFNPFTPTADYSPTVNGGSGYFDGTTDYLSLATNAPFSFGTNDFTIEWWQNTTDTEYGIIHTGSGGWGIVVTGGTLYFQSVIDSTNLLSASLTSYLKDQWTHFALVRNSGTLYLYINGVQITSAAYSTDISLTPTTSYIGYYVSASRYLLGWLAGLRVVNGAAVYTSAFTPPTAPPTNAVPSGTTELLLNFTNAGIVDATGANDLETVGNAQVSTSVTKWGSSIAFDGTGDVLTMKETGGIFTFGTGDYTYECWIYTTTGATTQKTIFGRANTGNVAVPYIYLVNSTGVLSLYYSATVVSSTTAIAQNTWTHIAVCRASGTSRLFINGVLDGSAADTTSLISPDILTIGGSGVAAANPFIGYIEDLRITKGYARYTGNFTVPDAPFAYDKSDINYKQWTPNNFSVTAGADNDSLVDTPTPYGTDTGAGGEVRGNYCTLNPLRQATGSGAALANGNLQFTCISAPTGSQTTFATMGVSSGKWYFEMLVSTTGGTYYPGVGVNTDLALAPTSQSGDTASGYMYLINGQKYTNSTLSAYGASFTANDVIGVALDMDAGTITFYKNGSSQGQAFSGISGTAVPCVVGLSSAAGTLNFGQRPFAYTAPSGFKALVTTNLPEPAVLQGDDYFNTVLYTGNGSTQSITGVGFQPDLVWIKKRTTGTANTATNVFDAVRGAGKPLFTSSTSAELTGRLTAFGSDGFTVDSDNAVNDNSQPLVAWNWKANGAGSSNTAGDRPSTVSVNTTAGISIVTFTGNSVAGATVGHGLGVAPAMIIMKNRAAIDGWQVYHKSLPSAAYRLQLNGTGAADIENTVWNSTAPTSTVFSVGTNVGNSTQVAYCFAEVEGYSKFGSFVGAGGTDNSFIYCGFRPAWVVIKRTDSTSNWFMHDSKRSPYNVAGNLLRANLSDAELSPSTLIDILSNGFKLRDAGFGSGESYIFMAFASNPLKLSLAR